MVSTEKLIAHCDTLLNSPKIEDYCPNGLQIYGSDTISKIICGVTANQQLIDQAINKKADAILVHHGYFWKGEDPRLISYKGERIRTLIKHNINLIAYHLPLDYHTSLGNNALWGKAMDLTINISSNNPLLFYCPLKKPISTGQLENTINQTLNRKPLFLSGGNHQCQTIAWCSGAAQDFIEQAKLLGADTFLSGEVSERTTHQAKELNIHYFSCGHHATETFGVKAIGEHLAKTFNIQQEFINIPNPV